MPSITQGLFVAKVSGIRDLATSDEIVDYL